MKGSIMEDPLKYLSRKELLLNVMQNIERSINHLHKNNPLKRAWGMYPNWAKCQKYLNNGTTKAGSTSSLHMCKFIGVDPDGKSFFK